VLARGLRPARQGRAAARLRQERLGPRLRTPAAARVDARASRRDLAAIPLLMVGGELVAAAREEWLTGGSPTMDYRATRSPPASMSPRSATQFDETCSPRPSGTAPDEVKRNHNFFRRRLAQAAATGSPACSGNAASTTTRPSATDTTSSSTTLSAAGTTLMRWLRFSRPVARGSRARVPARRIPWRCMRTATSSTPLRRARAGRRSCVHRRARRRLLVRNPLH